MRLAHPFLVCLVLLSAASPGRAAQDASTFRARLSTVPIDVAMQSTVAGSGRATATLKGQTLTIDGTFEGLKSSATFGKVHVGPKGIRGPAVLDLTVTNDTRGTLTGTFDLTPAQLDDLRSSRFYLQLHSEGAPEGNLWGWLLPDQARQ